MANIRTHKDIPANKDDIHAMMLNQLITIDNIYRAISKERNRQIQLCVNLGIARSRVKDTLRRASQ